MPGLLPGQPLPAGPVLAFDTALNACSVAVVANGEVRASETRAMERGQAEVLVPMIEVAMRDAGLSFDDLVLIGVTVGPGAFTGIRIGLAAARGFAVASGVAVAGVSTLDVLALSALENAAVAAPVLAAIDTKRGDVFVQRFGADGSSAGPAAVMDPVAAANLLAPGMIVCGDAAALVSGKGVAAATGSTTAPDPVMLARIAVKRHGAGIALPPEPLYLRPPIAKLPKDGGRLRP